MFVSKQLKEKNIAEYLIYMWQIEDLIRANGCDIEKIKSTIIAPYPLTEEQKAELTQWYMDLIEMMRHEGIMEKGHLQINKNIITWLTDLHLQLLRSPKFPYYNSAYYKVLPYIVELRAKGADKEEPELETCFEALYGILLLKLQKKEISEETRKAQKIFVLVANSTWTSSPMTVSYSFDISSLLSTLLLPDCADTFLSVQNCRPHG